MSHCLSWLLPLALLTACGDPPPKALMPPASSGPEEASDPPAPASLPPPAVPPTTSGSESPRPRDGEADRAPGAWKNESFVAGDLDGNGEPDIAMIMSREREGVLEARLSIALRKAGQLPTAIQAPGAVCAQCGGVKGTPVPFEVEIDSRTHVLSLSYFGGSREVRGRTTKWRLQNDQFELIGMTEAVTDTFPEAEGSIGSVLWDVNLSTHQMTETVETVSGPAKSADEAPPTRSVTTTCAVPKARGPVLLSAYNHESWETPRCSAAMVE